MELSIYMCVCNNIFDILQTSKLKGLTEGLEEKEQQLVNDCVQQLGKYFVACINSIEIKLSSKYIQR